MKKNKTKKLLWITAVFFTFIALILIINESYALLQTISSGSAEVKTGSWTIKINEKNGAPVSARGFKLCSEEWWQTHKKEWEEYLNSEEN